VRKFRPPDVPYTNAEVNSGGDLEVIVRAGCGDTFRLLVRHGDFEFRPLPDSQQVRKEAEEECDDRGRDCADCGGLVPSAYVPDQLHPCILSPDERSLVIGSSNLVAGLAGNTGGERFSVCMG
jgi:hypothetical protein